MNFLGLRGTGNFGTDERPKDFRETILWLNPNGTAPLTALMSRMKKEGLKDPEYSWWEETQDVVRLSLNGALLVGDTTFVVDSGALQLVQGDVLLVEVDDTGLGELIEVSADPTVDTSFTATRGAAGTTAAGIADGVFMTKIGNVFAEGTNSPTASNKNPTKLSNFAQIFKTTYELTNTTLETTFRTGDPVKNDKKRKMFDHSRDLEFAFLFGRSHETVGSNGKPKRYTGGLNEFIQTNRTVFTNDLTEDNLIDSISPVFDYDGAGIGNERLVFAGNNALTALNRLARNSASTRINFDGTIKVYGMELQKWIMPQGTMYVRTHPLMNTHGRFKNSMFVINPAGIHYRPLRDTRSKDNIQENDADVLKGMWLTEAGIEVHHERTMAYLGNVNSAAFAA